MIEEHLYRTQILPVPTGVTRPLWSIMIPTYNCANYLRETLTSVLAQDLGPDVMQIEVIDDYSTKDDPQVIVEEVGKGRVGFYRQPQNVGHIRNFNTCLQRSQGHLVHLLHGDDCVKDGFYRKIQLAFEQNLDIGAAFCRYFYIDHQGHAMFASELEQSERGIWNHGLEKIASKQRIQPPSMVVKRAVYEKIGGFDSRICCCGEDWEMWLRIATHYPIWYEKEILALYRIQSNSLTRRSARTGQNIRDIRNIIQFSQSYLPKPISQKYLSQARQNFANYYLFDFIPKLMTEGDLIAVKNQLNEVLKLGFSVTTLKQFIRIILTLSNKFFRQYISIQKIKHNIQKNY